MYIYIVVVFIGVSVVVAIVFVVIVVAVCLIADDIVLARVYLFIFMTLWSYYYIKINESLSPTHCFQLTLEFTFL